MIALRNEELASQFMGTILMMEEFVMPNDLFLIKDNQFLLFCNDMENLMEINLDTTDVKMHNVNPEVIENILSNATTIHQGDLAWSMCNMVNNALQQWSGCTPFQGEQVCVDLSRQATAALSSYSMNLKLNMNSMHISKNGMPITYEEAVYTILS